MDTLHFDRSGSQLAELATLDPRRLPFGHLCDARVHSSYTQEDLLKTAREDWLPPGAGEIDLQAILASLPSEIMLSVEVPQATAHGRDPLEVLRELHRASIAFLVEDPAGEH